MDLKSSSVKGVASEVEGKVGAIVNGGDEDQVVFTTM